MRARLLVLMFVGLVWSLALGQIGFAGPFKPFRRAVPRTQPAVGSPLDASKSRIVLSEGGEEEPAEVAPVASGRLLSAGESAQLLKRLPPSKPVTGLAKPFALREKSLPAPRPGRTETASFPPRVASGPAPSTAAGELRVLRCQPCSDDSTSGTKAGGDYIPLAPLLSVTFSQPMVPLTSHDDLAARGVPVRLVPQPQGHWRWLGTRTLTFEPKPRFAQATDYQVEIPAGTTSAVGGRLAQAARFHFRTPPLRLVSSYPSSQAPDLNPLMALVFDQAIDPAAVLTHTRLLVGGKPGPALRLATAAEIEANAVVHRLTEGVRRDRTLVVRCVSPLPVASAIRIEVAAGAPSQEGPLLTTSVQAFGFSTYGPMRLEASNCEARYPGRPGTPLWMRFTNPIDPEHFDKARVRVSPVIKGMKISVRGTMVTIQGATRGRTTYEVSVDPQLRDVHGQTLSGTNLARFYLGEAYPSLSTSGGTFVVLDPAARPVWSVYSINHDSFRLSVYKVRPKDYSAYLEYRRSWNHDTPAPPPGELLTSQVVTTHGVADELTETAVPLSPYLKGDQGNLVVTVEPTVQPREHWQRRKEIVWVEATRLAVQLLLDNQDVVAWVTRLRDGQPVVGAEVAFEGLRPRNETTLDEPSSPPALRASTDAQGLAHLGLPVRPAAWVIARQGDDEVFLPEDTQGWYSSSSGWSASSRSERLLWYVIDDRKLYRPDEEVHVKGWARILGAGVRGDLKPCAPKALAMKWRLEDSRGNEVLKGETTLDPQGGLDLSLRLPKTMNLGQAKLVLVSGLPFADGVKSHTFEVEEFRRPEFEVSASSGAGPYLAGEHGDMAVNARYYAGGGLSGAPVTWTVQSQRGSYTPPGRDGFSFGSWTPWWSATWWHAAETEASDDVTGLNQTQTFTGHTDSNGKHHVRVGLEGLRPTTPLTLSAQATVQDVNRQAWTARTTMLVHPASVYVGLKAERLFVQRGQKLPVQALVCAIDGKAVPEVPVRVRVERQQYSYETERTESTLVREFQLASTQEAVPFELELKEGGQYLVTATVHDAAGRSNHCSVTAWVAGAPTVPHRTLEQESVTLVPDRQHYKVGETAQVLVSSPIAASTALVTITHGGVVETRSIPLEQGSATLKIPVADFMVPGVQVRVDVAGHAPRTDDLGGRRSDLEDRPAYASGTLDLDVPPLQRTLQVQATPREARIDPGAQTEVAVQVRDAAGQPVANSQVTVVVVDDAVLAMTGYRPDNMVEAFYPHVWSELRVAEVRGHVQLVDPARLTQKLQDRSTRDEVSERGSGAAAELALPAPAPGGFNGPMRHKVRASAKSANAVLALDGSASDSTPIRMRSDFNPLALFAPRSVTDAQGRAVVRVKVPDNLTRYRIMAFAIAGSQHFGMAEDTLVARLPLMVRPSAPRFLNVGDHCELPVVLHNQTDQAMQVRVALRAANAELEQGAGRAVTVPANNRVEVRFPVRAHQAGTARFEVAAAVAGKAAADAAEVSLPVWTPATTEAFAVYGEVDDDTPVAQPVLAPSKVWPGYGGLEISTSSTQLQALTDALIYLVRYPYECGEQVASRLLSVVALKDVMTAFKAEGLPEPSKLGPFVARDIQKLVGLQGGDGGFGLWNRDELEMPFVTVHIAHALTVARAKGYAVPQSTLDEALGYLRSIESHYPSDYSPAVRRSITAYALYVRHLHKDNDVARARRLIAEAGGVSHVPTEALGWLLMVLGGQGEAVEITRYLGNHVAEEAATAHFVTGYEEGQGYVLMESERRTDAIVLEALLERDPKNDLIPKLVRGLLDHRVRGHWGNTQEDTFVLLALDRYFATFERVTPNFVARVWLGDGLAVEQAYKGRSTTVHETRIPLDYLGGSSKEQAKARSLVVARQGAGRLYYRLGLQYAPLDLKLAAAEHGFSVQRRYEALDKADDVRHDKDGTWTIKGGARVRVKVTMVAPSRRYHVALVDPLPAGLEAVNPNLRVSGDEPAALAEAAEGAEDVLRSAGGRYGRGRSWFPWWGPWYEHQNLRDERAEAFASLLWEGVYTYDYTCRATTPGRFVVPPSKAEEMYHPEIFGRSASDVVIVR